MPDETLVETDTDRQTHSAGPLTMVVDAGEGARIRSLTWNSREVLSRRDVHPTNHGSTFWDAPRSAWNRPPRAVLDEGVYAARMSGETLIATSAVDPDSGLTFEKRFRPNPVQRRVEILYIITNNSPKREMDVAGWEVTRVPGGFSFFPDAVDNRSPPRRCPSNSETTACVVTVSKPIRRRPDASSSASGVRAGSLTPAMDLLFFKRFAETAPGSQALGHGTVEIWCQDGGIYVELENHGPPTRLRPGDSLSARVDRYGPSSPRLERGDGDHDRARAGSERPRRAVSVGGRER